MPNTRVQNRLSEIRKSRGISPPDLARRVNASRQTIYAIEAGNYVPNTELALQLARELEVTVDELFSLTTTSESSAETVEADILSASTTVKGAPIRICRVGAKWVSIPASPTPDYLPEADGVVERIGRTKGRGDVKLFAKELAERKRIVIAGCDPATSLLSNLVEREAGVEILSASASSRLALSWLQDSKVHIAGLHLEAPRTGEFNLPFIREVFPEGDVIVVTFAQWEEGLVVAPGNPKGLRKAEDLARRGIRIVNREPGAGSRALLDRLLEKAGVEASQVKGYDQIAFGHLAAARHVLAGEADVCLATSSAASTFKLDFVPLHSARYDFAMRKQTADLASTRAFLDVLQRATLRRKLEVLAGYDTSRTGALVA